MNTVTGRRYLKFRELAIIQTAARRLSQGNITPNQISLASIVFAGLGGVCFLLLGRDDGANSCLLPLLAAVCIQCRLLCNLFDGLVAIEGGKQTAAGELFNDMPDRLSDALLLISAGYAIGVVDWGGALGWCAALLAVLTAYVRTLAVSLAAPMNFQGPMAKQHRMALLTAACVFTALENYIGQTHYVLWVAMIILILGCLITLYRRTLSVYHFLEHHDRA